MNWVNLQELLARRAQLIAQMRSELEKGDTADLAAYDALEVECKGLDEKIQRTQDLAAREATLDQTATRAQKPYAATPMINKGPLGDSEARAVSHYLRTGDPSGMIAEQRASNATDLNVGTSADGGYAVPTGLYNGIVAKRNELSLYPKLGVMPVPGKGTTVNVPTDNGTANVFVSTNEAASFDLDGPVLGQQAMALVKYTKKLQISVELLEDEDAKIMEFLNNYVGRALANTENTLLVAAAVAGGTTNALASASAASAADIPKIAYALKGEYADNAQWIMKRATEGAYRALTGSVFQFLPTPNGPVNTLFGYPVNNSEFVAAVGTGNKSSIFGNFAFMGRREGAGLTMLRDPYSAAGSGQVNIYFYSRLVYKVMVAEAIQYGTHP
jgi:HK97 family phage major capsid protein